MTSEQEGGGPVPVRDLMKIPRADSAADSAAEPEGEPRWERQDREFEAEGVRWIARTAGSGAYGTGNLGTARVLAIHFYRAGESDPAREALVPASAFPGLHDDELAAVLQRATPIVVDQG